MSEEVWTVGCVKTSMALPFIPPPIACCVELASEQLKACVTTGAMFAAGSRKCCPFDEAVYSGRHHWDVIRSETQVTGCQWICNTMKKQMVELNLLSEHAKGSAGTSSVSLCNHMEKLSLRTLMAIRAKCDMEICISHASSLPSVISAFCLLELVGPLQGDKETDAKWVSFPNRDYKCRSI